MVVHAYNSSGGLGGKLRVQGQAGIHRKILLQRPNQRNKRTVEEQ